MAAKRTDEGLPHATFYGQVNMCADICKIIVNIFIEKTDYFYPRTVKIIRTFFIMINSVSDIMLHSVNFNHESGSPAIKINNVITDNTLPVELNGICF